MSKPVFSSFIAAPQQQVWRRWFWRCALAVGAVAVATAVRWALNDVFGTGAAFITFYPAVAITGILAGGRAGLAATALSALIADLLFFEPRWTIASNSTRDWVALGIFAAGGALISGMAGMLGRARKREWEAAGRAKSAEQLRQTQERFRSVLEDSRDVIYRLNLQTRRYEYISPSAQDVVGFTPEEFMAIDSEKALSMVHPEDLPGMRAALGRLEETGKAEAEYRQQTRNGEYRWLSNHMALRRDDTGQPLYRDGSIRDATERKQKEEALRRSEEKFAKAFESSPVALVISRLEDGCLLDVNEAFANLVGYSRAELIGRNSVQTGLLQARERASMAGRLSQGDDLAQKEILLKTKHGETRWVLASAERVQLGQDLCIIWTGFDITERKRALEALQASEEQFRATFEVASVGKAQGDPVTGRILRVNSAFCRITGYSEAELLELRVADITHPDDREKDWVSYSRMGSGQASGYETEKRYVRRDGQVVWVRVSANLIRNAAGRPWRTSAVIEDITARKRAEEALRESEQRLLLALESARMGTWEVSVGSPGLGGQPFKYSRYIGPMFGEPEWYVHPNVEAWANQIHPEDRTRVRGEFERASRGEGIYDTEFRALGTDGKLRWIQSRGSVLRDSAGRPVRAIGIAMDITHRKQAEEALRQSEERLQIAKSAAQLGIHEFRPSTGELIWDERVRELWGMGPEASVSYDTFMSRLHPDDRVRTRAAMERALDPKGTGQYYAEYRLVRGERTIWVAATGQVTFENHRAMRLVGTMQDITERKAFQAELQRLVDQRTAKLKELVGELEHFSYTITHDMRAPLRGMQGFAELLADACHGCERQDPHGFLRRIQTSGRRMDALITDALNYSKAVRQELTVAPVELGALLRGMVDSYPELQAERAQIEIGGDLPLVMGNEAGLTQVFSNLLGNAVKFVKPGRKPEIRIWAETRKNRESGAADGNWVRVWVEDNGIGIPEAMKPRVFDMFSRGHNSYEGTGIGLALVRKVVERMGGKAGVESEEGQGSRFWVDLRLGYVRARN